LDVTLWLVDKSAFVRFATSANQADWQNRVDRGLVRISTLTRLEIGYSARTANELQNDVARPPLTMMPIEYLTPAIEDRALEVQVRLAERGQHRGPSIPDLLIAATAELAKLTVLHVDRDFDVIADITGQPLERLRLVHEP
jgi:predicted nucleic acid-binding protein